MVEDIRPETNIEWLWTLDLVELSWEILRYQRLKKRILDAHRVAAIEAILQRLDGEGLPAEAMPMVRARGGPPQNGATIKRPPTRLKRVSIEAGLMPSISMPRCLSKRESCSVCSTNSFIWHKTDAWACFERSASAVNI